MSLTKAAPSGVLPGPDFTNGPQIPPRFPTVTAAILHHVLAIPAEVAVIDHTTPEPRTMTYEQLGSRATHLAQHLRTLGVLPGDRIPLVARRGVEMTVGIVAILACGAQYVPLDGKVVPRDTLRRVVEQSGGKVAVCMEETVHRMVELAIEGCTSVVVEEHIRDVPAIDYRRYIEEELMKLTTEESGCYVIYTSGMFHCFECRCPRRRYKVANAVTRYHRCAQGCRRNTGKRREPGLHRPWQPGNPPGNPGEPGAEH